MRIQSNITNFVSKKMAGILVGVALIGTAAVASEDTGTLTEISSRFLFVANGFDNNDQVQVTLDGYLPNACYKLAEPKIDFSATTKTFTVTAMANKFEGEDAVCGQFEVPFTITASLGQVVIGDYFVSALGTEKRLLHIKPSSTLGPDDYLYAPVDYTHVSIDIAHKQITAIVEGRFTNSCMRFKEVKVLDQGESIVVLPIISLQDRADCHPQDMRYKAMEVKIPWRQPGRYLMHVRGLSGASINQVFEVDAL